jgi:MATE family multidrug resistance protein
LAWPIVLSNISVPLLGLVDTAVIGNLGQASLIGAIAIGAMIFSFLYWGFGFLRMGTTGLIAQASGADDLAEVKATLYRAILIGSAIGVCLLLLQTPLASGAFYLIDGSSQVESSAALYFDIRIWSAPATLINLAVLGYFLGRQATRTTLLLQLILNGSNIILDLVFVVGLDWEVAGVASATLIAEYLTLGVGLWLVIRSLKAENLTLAVSRQSLLDTQALGNALVVNRDIMIRTLCLIFCFAWFTNQGAQSGDVLLAANAILMQLVSFAAFFLDGFALAAESLVGHAVGAEDHAQLHASIKLSTELAVATALLITLVYLAIGEPVIRFLTNVETVVAASLTYLPWAVASPLVSVWCYQLDGIFIGATRTREMRNAMILSLLAFLLCWWPLQSIFGNHGLWATLLIYFLIRAATLAAKLHTIAPGPWRYFSVQRR